MSTPINKLIDSTLRCLKCGKSGVGTCECWEKCSCGWWADKGKPCGNPGMGRCSTKVAYGKYNRKSKRYE